MNYSQKRIGEGFMGYYKIPEGTGPFGVENFDHKRAMECKTSTLSHRKSERKVNLRSMIGRDGSIYEQSDFKINIELENTKD